MISAILVGMAVGFVLAIPPGPIGMAAIRTGIRDGWKAALKLGAGASMFDVLYSGLAMLATSAIVAVLHGLEETSPLPTIIIQFTIVGVMIAFGIMQIRERPYKTDAQPQKKPSGFIEWIRGHGPFLVGSGFAIANLANPTFIPSLAALTTFIQKLEVFEATVVNDLTFAVGFGAGNMLWLLVLVRLVVANKHRMTPTFIKRIQQLSGVTLIGFGTFYGIRILAVTKWAEVLRIIFAA
ncbi:MAG: LysE family transporter [Ignavibacteria bacterium]|nr:LysE family transporter [Ignavibacteria bacterium]